MSHLTRFQALLTEKGFDAAIVSDQMNQRYLSGFDFQDGTVLVTRKKAYLLTDFRYIEAAVAQVGPEFEVLTPEEGHLACIGSLLSDHACQTVLTEEESLSCSQYAKYTEKLQGFSLSGGASRLLSDLRLCKDDMELETIARAQAVTDAAFAHILGQMTPEMTEIDVALELEFFMRRNGAEAIAFETIAVSGSNSSRPHGVPRPVRLEKGFLTMDFGARVDGYCSDMTRTVVLGQADAEMKRLYQTVLKAQTKALAAACEGAVCKELDRIARDIIDGEGYRGCFGHSLGHGVGMLVHENPRLSPGADPASKLQRGHVVTFEPGIYLNGKYGCRIEDMVAIRNDGAVHNFTHSPKELIELF
ncbi:MAG: aminopeptidase P family protein [Clostridia bacterium]|nr:aminopeptidase P family protein [Clostridia bacterium]